MKEAFLKLSELEKREMFPGATARFLHTEKLTVDGDTRRMEAGSAAAIPSNVRHSGRSVSACTIIDVFCPAREDLK